MAEIQKISRECAQSTPQESAGKDSAEGTEPLQCRYALTGGIALPTGDFGSVMSGAAKPGFTLGAEFELRFSRNVGWVTQFNFSDNPFDEQAVHDVLTGFMGGGYDIGLSLNAKPWLSYLCVTGLKASAPLSPGFTVFCTGAMGVFIGTAPEITVSTYFGSFTQESATASAFAYSISVGFVIGDIFRCDAKYLSATPKYSQNSGDPVEQPTSIVLVEVGVEF
ncbi:MAG TPA: hypothetical protein VK569_09815 [Bacteroidota bacterium]|nr:hypothetical protein [Bacteroidota bacterium]